MMTELEKQFFDTFGIEPKLNDCNWQCQKPSKLIYMCANNNDCEHCKEYPQITDRHYLELIVLHNIYLETKLYHLEVKLLKEEILQDLIYEQQLREIKKDDVSDDLKHQVQAIFEEG